MASIDALECRAYGREPRRALHLGYMGSPLCWTGLVDGRPEAMFGCVPGAMCEGQPWLLGTERARALSKPFLAIAPAYVAQMAARYPRLSNLTHQTNTASQAWLRRLGFTVDEEVRLVGEEPFVRFWLDV